jgi:hypothetical protein
MSKFQLYYGENKLHFDNDDIRFDLDTLSWSFIELAQLNRTDVCGTNDVNCPSLQAPENIIGEL